MRKYIVYYLLLAQKYSDKYLIEQSLLKFGLILCVDRIVVKTLEF